MRTSQLVTSYIQALIFVALGVRCVTSWVRQRDSRSAHLALAAGLFGTSSLLGAITSTIYDSTKGEIAPRWETIVSSIIIFFSVYFFLLFLSDFIEFLRQLNVLWLLVTIVNIVLAAVERPDIRFDPRLGLVKIPNVHNPFSYRGYIGYVLLYLAVAFGILAFAFLIYGFRTRGLARFRLLFIGSGFLLLFVAIGLLPRLVFGSPTAKTIRDLTNVVQYVALACGPLLFLGFSPPAIVRNRFQTDARPDVNRIQSSATPMPLRPSGRTNGLAIASLVLALVGASVLALVFGYIAKDQIRKTGDSGEGMAKAGIVIGWIDLIVGLVVILAIASSRS